MWWCSHLENASSASAPQHPQIPHLADVSGRRIQGIAPQILRIHADQLKATGLESVLLASFSSLLQICVLLRNLRLKLF
jgi:hypothetical protein